MGDHYELTPTQVHSMIENLRRVYMNLENDNVRKFFEVESAACKNGHSDKDKLEVKKNGKKFFVCNKCIHNTLTEPYKECLKRKRDDPHPAFHTIIGPTLHNRPAILHFLSTMKLPNVVALVAFTEKTLVKHSDGHLARILTRVARELDIRKSPLAPFAHLLVSVWIVDHSE